jgi:hypothetical protein
MGVFSFAFCFRFLSFFLFILFAGSCDMAWSPKSPRGSVIPRPEMIILPKKLNEISGIYYITADRTLLAITDDKRKIYTLTPEGEDSLYFEEGFAEQQDFEDVVKVKDVVYTLVSDGSIVAVRKTDSGSVVLRYPPPSAEKNDFETLYFDSSANGLIMLCKECAFEKGKGIRTALRFDLSTMKYDQQPFYTIETKSVRDALKDGVVEFKPSAAAIHPIEKRLYILGSAGHLLVVCDLKGKVQEVFRLNPTFYPQAEGIAFAANGDMFISNEAKLGKPTLLKIAYKPSGK